MRATLAIAALVVTSMIALSFLVPLALLLRTQVRTQATLSAEQRAVAVLPALAISPQPDALAHTVAALDSAGRLCVHLPGGQAVGTAHASPHLLAQVVRDRSAVARSLPGGWDYLQPVLMDRDQVAVVEEFVPQAELNHGVLRAWAVMALLAMGLVAGSVLLADRLGARMVRASRRLSAASAALGGGDLEVRVEPTGPHELRSAGEAFNTMANRVSQLLATERELVADLSHRLRTPLTALSLAAERIGPVPGAPRLSAAIHHLESELDEIIVAARTPLATRPLGVDRGPAPRGSSPARGTSPARTERHTGESCQVAELARHRVGFWSVLAEQQGRTCSFEATDEPTPVRLPEDHLAAAVDALVGNVFRHTPEGTGFAVSVQRTAQSVLLVVEDGGRGIEDPDSALSRGVSNGGSTGLGLDIARTAAQSTRGHLRIQRSELGGARVEVALGLAADSRRTLGRAWRHRRRRAAESLGR
ncbi:sensor histidine kinase [Kitasatospora kifunensis]|uniref:histidine kinase n=1 Tax=Kitasatospora kifunensis TaxID=58351 RepID=A0A7W7RBB9_KITKI|nr:HAMP domain-containing sensor histidine kinase [Kitasatospora kifunensis]MBB4928804.1 signal transduction histidine kinase [Kitasatospora kifunensis]